MPIQAEPEGWLVIYNTAAAAIRIEPWYGDPYQWHLEPGWTADVHYDTIAEAERAVAEIVANWSPIVS